MDVLDKYLLQTVNSYLIECRCCRYKYHLEAGIHVLDSFVCDSCVYHAGLFTLAARFGNR